MQKNLKKSTKFSFLGPCLDYNRFSSLVTPMFNDSHPRVRYAACQCVLVSCRKFSVSRSLSDPYSPEANFVQIQMFCLFPKIIKTVSPFLL